MSLPDYIPKVDGLCLIREQILFFLWPRHLNKVALTSWSEMALIIGFCLILASGKGEQRPWRQAISFPNDVIPSLTLITFAHIPKARILHMTIPSTKESQKCTL